MAEAAEPMQMLHYPSNPSSCYVVKIAKIPDLQNFKFLVDLFSLYKGNQQLETYSY